MFHICVLFTGDLVKEKGPSVVLSSVCNSKKTEMGLMKKIHGLNRLPPGVN